MRPQFQHELMTSFMLWFDNHLLTKGSAFSNQTGKLYYHKDDRLPSSYNAFASSYKQWVTDSSVPGAIIPTEFMGTGRSQTAANNSAITGFKLQGVGAALVGSSDSFDSTYTINVGVLNSNGRRIFNSDTISNHRITLNQGTVSKPETSGLWEIRAGAPINRAAWRATTTGIGESQTPFAYPWTVTGWKRQNALANVGSGPVFSDFLVSGSSGFVMDFENGRILETGGSLLTDADITGTFAVKDFNIYLTNDTEEDLILNSAFELNSRYEKSLSGVKPYDKILPAIFINSESMRNEGFAFGGEDKTVTSIKAVVMAENQYQLDGALSIFSDTRYKTFNHLPFTGHPITELGDVKDGLYNYNTTSTNLKNGEYYIEDVITSKLSERTENSLPDSVKVGFIDFDVSINRFPRA